MRRVWVVGWALLSLGCEGLFSDGAGALTQDLCAGTDPKVTVQPARRLTRREYLTTLRQLLPGVPFNEAAIPQDATNLTFDTAYEGRGITEGVVDAWFVNAERISLATAPSAYLPCSLASGTSACVDRFIAELGRKAFRRALTAEEKASLRQVYDEARTTGQTPAESVGVVLHAFLVSPQLLFRLENTLGTGGEVVPADALAYASRVSFFLWGAAPDEALLAAAEKGELATRDGLRAQVQRMVLDPRAREQVRSFHHQWTRMDKVEAATRDASMFPDFPAQRASMIEEADRFFDNAFWNLGKLADLLTSRRTFVDQTMATLYGVPYPGEGSGFVPVDLTAGERSGLLTLPALMTATANPNRTSPTRRGHFVVSQLLCQEIKPPPPGAGQLEPPAPGEPPKTNRERFQAHVSDPSCAGCHGIMDPPGFILEGYDAVGQRRTTENGVPLDTTGALTGSDVDGTVGNAVELAERLATSAQVMDCVADQWIQYALSKPAIAQDACSASQVKRQFRDSGGDFRELLVSILDSDSFRYVKTEDP